jgi:hypothetical protein
MNEKLSAYEAAKRGLYVPEEWRLKQRLEDEKKEKLRKQLAALAPKAAPGPSFRRKPASKEGGPQSLERRR